jgi:cytoskeletal protein RodZ
MALSMDEQRALAEIERRLAADDPGLAACLTAFRRPGPARVLSSPRARIIGSLFTILLVAMVSLMVYAMIPFRSHVPRPGVTPGASVQDKVSMTASGASGKPHSSPPASANSSAASSSITAASAQPPARGATPSAGLSAGTTRAQPASSQPASSQAASSQAASSQAASSQAASSQAAGHVSSPAAGP